MRADPGCHSPNPVPRGPRPAATGSPNTSLARLKTGGGAGELWLNWHEGMDANLPITASLELESTTWGKPEKVPDAIRLDSLLRVNKETIDQDLFNHWIDGIIAAAGSSRIPAWPPFALDHIIEEIRTAEPGLPSLLKMLEAGPRTIEDLRNEAGENGKKVQLSINRLISWTNRYNKPSPLVASAQVPDAIEINADYRDVLLTRLT